MASQDVSSDFPCIFTPERFSPLSVPDRDRGPGKSLAFGGKALASVEDARQTQTLTFLEISRPSKIPINELDSFHVPRKVHYPDHRKAP